jgi:hypothetical protein
VDGNYGRCPGGCLDPECDGRTPLHWEEPAEADNPGAS